MKTLLIVSFSLLGLFGHGLAQDGLSEVTPEAVVASDLLAPSEPTVFREIGAYRVQTATLLKLGKATDLIKGKMLFRVFTDGVDVRISPDGADESYITFQIYRAGEIYDETGENLLQGLLAFSDQGEVVRHLCVQQSLLTLTKFPTSSNHIEVIYAVREKQ